MGISSGRAVLLFLGFLALYTLTIPVNHIESIDRHAYALWAERIALTELIDTRSILFATLNRGLYAGFQLIGLDLPATTLITAYSVLSGAGAVVLMARLLSRHFRQSEAAATLGACLMGLSYGFWRYATEVELYVASIFLVLAALNLLLDRLEQWPSDWRKFILPGVFSGLVVMFYQPNVFPLFLAIPVLFLARDRLAAFFAYGTAGTATVLLSYLIAFLVSRDQAVTIQNLAEFVGSRNSEFHIDDVGVRALSKMALAISHDLLSSNWLFGVEPLTSMFEKAFPATDTDIKVLSAQHYQPWVWVPILLLPVLLGTIGVLLNAARKARSERPWRLLTYLGFWLVIYTVAAGILDPGVSEVWISIVPPIVIFATVLVIGPAVLAGYHRAAWLLVVVFGAWNWFGGMGMLKNPEGDYYQRQTVWLQANATEYDVVLLTHSTWRLRTYLQHVTPARIVDLEPGCDAGIATSAELLDQTRAQAAAQTGRVFVLAEFIQPPERLAYQTNCAAWRDNAIALAQSVQGDLRPVDGEGAFALYQILPQY